ncbi:Cell division protein FtsA [Salinivirga cyanobacteriivorans]|uniref:Cell division protein FtsA n=1 Tax=Salinivirga cyanobacteriivorans TaxID=1307839 RepID=A0A0S2HYQ6_9BACT|nr:cell division protein FtsA [Salinivirga cyanobacteriivorans]ALO15169.1 Cell division protein FtsA [Salinivirga cyanobacteriivorans]
MAQKNSIISAIDIGTTKIVAIIGRKTDSGKFEILGVGRHDSKGVRRGEVLNIEETVRSIQAAVDEAESNAGLKIKEVYVGIAGAHIRSQRTSGYIQLGSDEEEITEAHTNELMDQMYNTAVNMGEEIIHVLPQGYTVDDAVGVENPIGVAGKRLEGNFHVVIGKISAANNIKKCVTRVGLKVKKLVMEPLASSRAVLSNDELEAGVAMIDIGGGTTDLAVYRDNCIVHTAVIPLGGYSVTSDIKEGCKIVLRYAEKLKKEFGRALVNSSDKNKVVKIPGINGMPHKEISFVHLAGIIQARMEEIIEQVIYHLDSNNLRGSLGAGIVVTGGGSMLKTLPQLMSYKTGQMARVGKPRVAATGDSSEIVHDPALATAIGLIMEGHDDLNGKNKNKESNNLFDFETPVAEEKTEETENKQETTQQKNGKNIKNKVKTLFGDLFDLDDTQM